MPYPRCNGLIALEAPNRGGAGAPPLPSSVWLEQELKRLGTPTNRAQHRQFYHAWLALHFECRGWILVDPRRSFRAAVDYALRRLRRKK